MLLLLGILKRNNRYYMNVINTEKKSEIDDYQFINPYVLSSCVNINVQHYLSNKQNPKEYLRGEFDVTDLIVDDNKLRKRVNDYQIISIYYDEENKPCLYKAVDRAGNISIHDISEFEYTKRNSILGDDLNKLPSFVEHKSLSEAYDYLKENKLDESKIGDMPVGLVKHYLIGTKGFKEGYHIVTEVNHGVPMDVHEYMLFNGSATLKLIEYVPKEKGVYLTKQDDLTNSYPKERTLDFLPGSIVLLGSKRLVSRFCKFGINTEFSLYNSNTTELSIPYDEGYLALFDKYKKSKGTYEGWRLDSKCNISEDIYKNILPNEIFKLPNYFYRDMKRLPFTYNKSYKLEKENDYIKMWMYTVSLLVFWQYYNDDFKKKLKPIILDYQNMYQLALNNLVRDIGPRDTLVVMKWMREHLKSVMVKAFKCDATVIDENESLFTFSQNEYSLPESLRVYSEETIDNYGGVDKLMNDFNAANSVRKNLIINELEKNEKDLCTLDESKDINKEHSLKRSNN